MEKKIRTNNVECYINDIVPQYVTLKMYLEFWAMNIAFHISKEQYQWLSIYCEEKHFKPVYSKGKYYLTADYAFDYSTSFFSVMTTMAPLVKNEMMIWMRRAKMSILQREINKLSK